MFLFVPIIYCRFWTDLVAKFHQIQHVLGSYFHPNFVPKANTSISPTPTKTFNTGIAKITETFLLAEKKSSVMITMASARETLFANVLEKLPNKRKDTAGIQNIPRVEHIDATDGVQKQTETNPSSFERPIENPNKPL
jgi:hypothetical protein